MPPTEPKEPEVDKIFAERAEFYKSEQERRAKEETPPEADKPNRKGSGAFSRAGMEAIIKGGGSVIHMGKHYGKVEDLPDEATLTEGDEKASAASLSGLDAQIAALGLQRAALEETHKRNQEAEKKKTAEPKAEPAHPSPAKK